MARNLSSANAALFMNVVFRDEDGNCSTLSNALREKPTMPKSNKAFRFVRALETRAWSLGEDLEEGQDTLVIDESFIEAAHRNGCHIEIRVRKPGEAMNTEAQDDANAILGF